MLSALSDAMPTKEQGRGNVLVRAAVPPFNMLPPSQFLDLSDNGLSGQLPPSLANATGLRVLRAARNRLSGALPSSFDGLHHLTELVLDGNAFSVGALVRMLVSQSSQLLICSLSNNNFKTCNTCLTSYASALMSTYLILTLVFMCLSLFLDPFRDPSPKLPSLCEGRSNLCVFLGMGLHGFSL